MQHWGQLKHNKNAAAGINLGPDELADLLNQHILNPQAAIARYEQVVADAVDAQSGSLHMSEASMHFQQMIKELNPDLQNQFLSATFDR